MSTGGRPTLMHITDGYSREGDLDATIRRLVRGMVNTMRLGEDLVGRKVPRSAELVFVAADPAARVYNPRMLTPLDDEPAGPASTTVQLWWTVEWPTKGTVT